MNDRRDSLIDIIYPPLLGVILLLSAWQIAVSFTGISAFILPAPKSVFSALIDNWSYLVGEGLYTLLEAVLGFLLGGSLAIVLAILFQFSKVFERATYPHAIALKAIPLVALAPLVTVWAGTGILSKILLAAIISFFPIMVNAAQGLSRIDAELLDLMRMLSASKWQILIKIRLPSSMPLIFSGMKIACTFAFIGAVVAEFISSSHGIGNVTRTSSYYLDTDITFAAIIVMSLSSLMFFGIVCIAERVLIPWQLAHQQEGTADESLVAKAKRERQLLSKHRQHRNPYTQRFKGINLVILPEVFSPIYGEGASLLADNMELDNGEEVLELGTGSGALAIFAALKGASVVATDISTPAVQCASDNAKRLDLEDQVDIRQGDLFSAVQSEEKFSLILFNPPFMKGKPKDKLEMAIYDEDYSTLKTFMASFPRYLQQDGRVLIAFSSVGEQSYFDTLVKQSGYQKRLVEQRVIRELVFSVFELKHSDDDYNNVEGYTT